MMTLKELEETADEYNDSYVNLRSLHSTQSISGRQSLLTHNHVQYLSASDALRAYIDSFEGSHPLQSSLYQRTVEDLLLPKSVLSRTGERSLETGKSDTKEELHLYHNRKIIDESFNEILKRGFDRIEADSLPESGIIATNLKSDLSSLPDPRFVDDAQLTPLLKSTPLTQKHAPRSPDHLVQESSKGRDSSYHTVHFSKSYPQRIHEQVIRDPKDGRNRMFDSLTRSVKISPSPYPKSDTVDRGEKVVTLDHSMVSGGRLPPSWVDNLDISSVTATSWNQRGSVKIYKGEKSKETRTEKRHLNDKGSVSSYGVDEVAILREVDDIVEKRRKERVRKQAEERQMRERWLADRRNESRLMQPRGAKLKHRKTESVTTDDLITASPYGFGPTVNKFPTDKNRVRYSRNSPDYLIANKERISMKQKSRLSWNQPSLGLTSVNSTARKKHHVPFYGHRNFRKYSTSEGNEYDVIKDKSANKTPKISDNSSPTGTESLLHASPFGQNIVSLQHDDQVASKLEPASDNYNENILENYGGSSYSDGGTFIQSTGDTSRINAVLQRAQRLMEASKEGGDLFAPSRKSKPARVGRDYRSSDEAIDRYLEDCLEATKETAESLRPLESLKQILYTLQDLEDSQAVEARTQEDDDNKEHSGKFDDVESVVSEKHAVITSNPPEDQQYDQPGTHSLKKAMAHLSRLKVIISKDDGSSVGSCRRELELT